MSTVALPPSYRPASRGSSSRLDLVVRNDAVDYPLVTALDFLILLGPCDAEETHALLERAHALGNRRAANIVALGAPVGLTERCSRAQLEHTVETSAPAKFRALNVSALHAGYALCA